ncbi:tyrosine-type recombinase/integrase (plasmid) [Flammeovirga sp. MY04]|uniref:tyrosine-type recombinase/integrase n=1 Tax=Flammeovirga sp. MY04 TaxID=1191459 RepID=UPI000825042A|nr:tyrosine-type recombinase/integrase [Flammeovirga sp. MY04]ANQ52896.2 tyrosine-type recombinase/integrase [Flammeovirga sp. MY04]
MTINNTTLNTRSDRKYLTIEEQEELIRISADHSRNHTLILLMLHAGCRITEALNLTISDIDFRARLVFVTSLKKRPDHKIRERKVPMSSRLYKALVTYCTQQHFNEGQKLFERNGINLTRGAVNKILRKYEMRSSLLAGTNIHPHKLRHTFATMLRTEGAKTEDIKDALGHQNIATSLIYAHQEPKTLKELVESSTNRGKKKTWVGQKLELVKNGVSNVFGKKTMVLPNINTLSKRPVGLVGRKAEMQRLLSSMHRDINTIILGDTGVGKSFVLENMINTVEKKVLKFDDTRGLKKSLTNTLLLLFDGDKEEVKRLMFQDIEQRELHIKISKENTLNIAKMMCQVCEAKEYILCFDNLDDISPASVRVMEILAEHFVIVGTARSVPVSKATFLWSFERIQLQNLKRNDAMGLIYRQTSHLECEDLAHLKTAIWESSQGNPRMIIQLIDRLSKESYLDKDMVNEITETYLGRELKQLDMSVYFLLLFGGLAVLRYMSAEVGNNSLRFIGGGFMIFSLFARYFFNSFRRGAV